MTNKRNPLDGSSGGSATAGGMDYQHRVAAWAAIHILAERDSSIPWNLGAGTIFDSFRCETEQPVDDLFIETSYQGRIFVQVKHTLQLSARADSDLASALGQFVRQFIACRSGTLGMKNLDPTQDRLVLITSPNSSSPIRTNLPRVLNRLRKLSKTTSVEKSAMNEAERRVVKILTDHIIRAWRSATEIEPSGKDFRELLSLMYIEILDVDEGGTGEREIKSLLRTTILRDPNQAEIVWPQLISICSGLAVLRAGADRAGLQQKLLRAGIPLKIPRSYQNDIQRLKEFSEMSIDSLSRHSHIQIGSVRIKIERESVRALMQGAEQGSLLVTGEPGSGKSGALYEFVQKLTAEGQDYVFLAIDHLASHSPGALRTEIGLEHELLRVLDSWPGVNPAFLVIDALDAARGGLLEKMIRALISSVIRRNNRWRVIASVRKFDLRYSLELQSLFRGSAHAEFHDAEFADVQHLNIPRLSGDELAQVSEQSAEFHALVSVAPTKLIELLHIPYNLSLLAELLTVGILPTQLALIKTQLDLLDRYWLERIVGSDGFGDAREAILRSVCKKMVRARELRISREDIANGDNSIFLDNLLSKQVLIEWQSSSGILPDRYTLAFSHHVLFDYAVAQLLLRSSRETVSQQLINDPDMIIVVRPSILWHFQFLWNQDQEHQLFWALVFEIMQLETAPEIGKLIGATIAAKSAESLKDLEPLFTSLEQGDQKAFSTAEQTIRHLIGSLLADTPADARLTGSNVGPWDKLLERISRNLRPSLTYPIQSLLLQLCDDPDKLSDEQRIFTGITARRLLEFAWSHEPRDGWLVIHSAQCVCRTFESDLHASANLIRRSIEPSHLSEFGFDEMPRLVGELKHLVHLDARLVEDTYRAVFGHLEKSNQETSIGQSQILPLRSNRRQDYQMALFELERIFSEFLRYAPENATRALLAVMESYILQHHSHSSGKWTERTFHLNGHEAHLRSDYSSSWDASDVYHMDESIKMLDTFQNFLQSLAEQGDDLQQLNSLIQIVVRENRYGVFWRRLLILGSQYPNIIGKTILPLAWTMPILTDYDTSAAAGAFIKAVLPLSTREERLQIENALVNIPSEFSTEDIEVGKHIQERFLSKLVTSEIITDTVKQLLAELKSRNVVPDKFSVDEDETIWSDYGEKESLLDRGVPVDSGPNRRIQDLEGPVKEFADKHLNSVPTRLEFETVFPAIKALYEAITNSELDNVHQLQKDYVWGYLAAASNRIARMKELSTSDSEIEFIVQLLLTASRHSIPTPDPNENSKFDESPSWSGPSARIEAAQGLITLAGQKTLMRNDVFEVIDSLLTDPVAAVRYQIALRLNNMYETRQEAMWRMIENVCREETSYGVLQGVLGGPLTRIAGSNPDRVAELSKFVFDRLDDRKGSDQVRERCVDVFVNLYVWRSISLCRELLLEIASSPKTKAKEALHLLWLLRKPVTHGSVEQAHSTDDEIRKRAIDLLKLLVSSACNEFKLMEDTHTGIPFNEWSREEQRITQSLAQILDKASSEVYFASGAYEMSKKSTTSEEKVTSQQMKRFYQESADVLDELAGPGLAGVTYHLAETLEAFVSLDPRGVFLRIGQIIRTGQKGGYQYESLGADLMVRLVERYLADYRTLLQQDSECRQTLVQILDIFVQAGWPSARRLTYHLEEIFR